MSVAARSSTSPVASLGLMVAASRRTTAPVTVITLSTRSRSAASSSSEPAGITIWVMP